MANARKGNKGKRRFIDAPLELRCKFDIKLPDGSGAQCGRRQAAGSCYCKQHLKIFTDRANNAEDEGKGFPY